MSVWNIGIDDVSEETRNFRDKISSKESQISAQQMKLMKQAAEMDELRSTLNDTLHKLTRETKRVLQLETDLDHRSEELRNEKIMSQNMVQTLAAAQEKFKLGELEARELQANLESLSHTSDGHSARSVKLERDKNVLESRVRELEANLRQLSSPPSVPEKRGAPRPRSSSLSTFRISSLERELNETRISLAQKENDLWAANQSLSQARGELLRMGNEKESIERRVTRELAELQSSLEQKEDELQYWQGQQDNGRREEELMMRIEEDDARIVVLEKLLADTQESPKLKDKLEKAEEKLREERKRRSEYETRNVELVKEKEDALDELGHTQDEISRLTEALKQHDCVDRKGNAISANETTRMSTEQPSTLPPMPQEAVTHIERLLVAIDRLRDERDSLQRDMHFLESESKFAVDALNDKLAASSISKLAEGSGSGEAFIQMQTEIEALRGQLATAAMQLSEAIFAKDKHIERLVLAATASAVAIEHLQSQLDHLERRFLDGYSVRAEAEENLKNSRRCVEGMEDRLEELEVKLEVTSLCLQATTSQRNDAMTQLEAGDAERDDEIREVKRELLETRDTLEQAEIRSATYSKALEDMESERNSLALQITNLSTDLRIAQEDLANAENRYSILQSHQLSSMSSNEATRLLQDQIQELEMRVMRRTEQIGIHQHDIKRLETNLRLQEERLGEMTIELEMMAAQKNAMVEDCADAREARDEALVRLDRLEIDMETRVEESDEVAATLVAVIFETVSHSRDAFRQSIDRALKAEREVNRLNTARQQILDQNLVLLDSLRSSDQNVQQSSFAQAALQSARTCIHSMQGDGDHLGIQQEGLAECVEAVSRSKELETLQSQASKEIVKFSVRTSELEAQVIVLQNEFLIAEAKHHAAIDELVRSRELLQKSLDETRRASLGSSNLEDELARVEVRHTEELGGVQLQLIETSNELKDLQARHASDSAEYHQALSDASKTKQELEGRLAEASETLRLSLEEKQKADREASAGITRLRTDLDVALVDARTAQDSREELQILYDRVLDELTQLRQDHEASLAGFADRSLAIRQELGDRLAELQSRFDGQSIELDSALQETSQLAQKLQDSLEQLSVIEETHQKELRSADQQRHSAECALTQHQREITIAKSQLEQLRTTGEAVQAEKLSLQEELTTLKAEFQRSSSLRHFLESQEQDSRRKIASLTNDLERTQADLARSEKLAKAAEVNLSLQGAQQKREMADLQRELQLLRSQPNLSDIVCELEERNNEMEELLRNKCAEIEENDDRALEMLKENKKLTSKVESLTRKVQNLQTKLAVAKASVPRPESNLPNEQAPSMVTDTTPSTRAAPRASSASSGMPPAPAHPPSPAARAPSHRTPSTSSSRPKTPEVRAPAQPPVFKARTPEKRVSSVTPPDATSSATTIGKKRPAPDDFDACESVPPQGFTTESLPSHELEKEFPRVRRALQSGFTPVRHKARPALSPASPKRPAVNSTRSSPPIADVTNSPRAASQTAMGQSGKPSKRSWLGKIRGVSTQTGGRDTRQRVNEHAERQ